MSDARDTRDIETGSVDAEGIARRIGDVGLAISQAADELKQAARRLLAAEEEVKETEVRVHAAEREANEAAERLFASEERFREGGARVLAAEEQAKQAELLARAAEEEAAQAVAKNAELVERFQDAELRVRTAEEEANQATERLVAGEEQVRQAETRVRAVEEQAAQTAAKNAELVEQIQQVRGERAEAEERARRTDERLQATAERARLLEEQVTELKARLSEIKRSQPMTVVVDKERTALQEAVAAEVRRPLTSILGITLALKHHDPKSGDGQEMVRQLSTNARRLDRLVTVLLELERLADGTRKPNRRRTDLQALVRRVVEESPDLANRDVHVEAERVTVAVDPTMTEQMVEALLANTGRRTTSGGPVWVKVSSDPEGAVIAVDDTGPEVPEGLREALLASLQEDRAASTRGKAPTGLTMLTRLAELHGGRAWVEERQGGGASFRVFLPDVLETSDEAAPEERGAAALIQHEGTADQTVPI